MKWDIKISGYLNKGAKNFYAEFHPGTSPGQVAAKNN